MALRSLTLLAVVLGLAACGETETSAPAAKAEPAKAAAPAAVSAPAAASAAPATGADLERSCREVVSRIYGQEGPAVTYSAQGPGRAAVSWRAPVDGGVLQLECRADQNGVGLFREGRSVSLNTQAAGTTADQEAR